MSDTPPPELKARLGRIKALVRSGELIGALREVEGLTDQHPDAPEAWARAASVYLALHMRERAMTMLAQAVLLEDPPDGAARLLAKAVAKRAGRRIRDSIGEVMLFLRDLGFRPGGIVDVGVNTGTPGLCEFFPDAHVLMVDPLEESVPFMQDAQRRFATLAYECCAAGAQAGEMDISVDPGFGGSRLVQVVGRHAHGRERRVPVRRVDEMVQRHGLRGPLVLKVDTEGAEHQVLAGAEGILPETEVLILETRVKPIASAPDVTETLALLASLGFAPYDIIERNYSDDDQTLKQFDLVAVRRDGFFRTPEAYRRLGTATPGAFERTLEAKLEKRRRAIEKLG